MTLHNPLPLPASGKISEPGRKAENVGIVMLACKGCKLRAAAECGTDAGNFVGRNRYTDTGTAEQDSLIVLSGNHSFCYFVGIIGVID
jgi:hypothetical protein